ncbi:MAG: DUF3347 domain-containing protein [Ferruginibacter sp.]
MKNLFFYTIAVTIIFTACNNSNPANKEAANNSQKTTAVLDTSTKQQTTPSEIKAAVSIKEIVENYLQMKNAFAKDNDKAAATAGDEMVKSFASFNKTALTPDQVKIYNDITDDAKEHAEHIGKNAGNIKHQREHFDMLSKDVFQLVKTFGAGQQLYYDHCPMYNDGKGANWLSETKDIQNPYLGKSMLTCGSVKEQLK